MSVVESFNVDGSNEKHAGSQHEPLMYPSPAGDLSDHSFAHRNIADLIERALPEKKQRSLAEVIRLKRTITLLARVFSKNYDLDVVPSPTGGWACGTDPQTVPLVIEYVTGRRDSLDDLPAESFEPKQILYDVHDLVEMPEEQVLGVLRHEIGHANHSDYKLLFQGQRIAHDEGFLPTSWMGIANALEDPWVNNKEIAGSEVVRQKLAALYSAYLPEIVEQINTQPLTRQLGLNINYYWITGESIPTIRDQRVRDCFEKIRPFVDQFFAGATAQENFELLKDHIWPVYRELEQKATHDEARKELARALSGSDLGMPGGSNEGKRQGQGSAQSNTEQGNSQSTGIKGLFDKIKKALGFSDEKQSDATSPQEQQAHEKEKQEIRSAAPGDLKKKLKKELEQQQAACKENSKKRESAGEPSGYIPDDIDLASLPEELQREMEELLNQLPGEIQRQLESRARKNLDQKQAEALRQDGQRTLQLKRDSGTGEYVGTFREPPKQKDIRDEVKEINEMAQEAEAHEAELQQEAQEQQAQQERTRQDREQKEREEQTLKDYGFEDHERELFAQFRILEGAMRGRIRNFMRILDQYLPKRTSYTYAGEHYSGRKFDRRELGRRIPVKDYRIYKRQEPVLSTEPKMFVKLIIDNSGSMAGQKMEESLKTAVFWARVLRSFDIPFSITFFGSHSVDVMSFDQDYDDPKQRIKPNLMTLSDASSGSTNMGDPLSRAKLEMEDAERRYRDFHGAIFVISDSGANQGVTGEALQHLIRQLQNKYTVKNFLLSGGHGDRNEANFYFGEENVIAPDDFSDLPEESFRALRVALQRVLRRHQERR